MDLHLPPIVAVSGQCSMRIYAFVPAKAEEFGQLRFRAITDPLTMPMLRSTACRTTCKFPSSSRCDVPDFSGCGKFALNDRIYAVSAISSFSRTSFLLSNKLRKSVVSLIFGSISGETRQRTLCLRNCKYCANSCPPLCPFVVLLGIVTLSIVPQLQVARQLAHILLRRGRLWCAIPQAFPPR